MFTMIKLFMCILCMSNALGAQQDFKTMGAQRRRLLTLTNDPDIAPAPVPIIEVPCPVVMCANIDACPQGASVGTPTCDEECCTNCPCCMMAGSDECVPSCPNNFMMSVCPNGRLLDNNGCELDECASEGECVWTEMECQNKCDTEFSASFAVDATFAEAEDSCVCSTEITIEEFVEEVGSVEEVSGNVEIDLQILLDATASMSDSIEAMSNALIDMIDNIIADVKAETGFDAHLRVGVVAYRDPLASSSAQNQHEFIPFTTDNAAVDAFLSGVQATGGGSIPEDVNGGLVIALGQAWTSEHKFIVHITDAPARGIPAPDAAGINYADLFAEINDKKITYIFGKLTESVASTVAAYNEVYLVDEAGVIVEDATDAEIDMLDLMSMDTEEMTVTFTTELVTKIVTRVETKIVTHELEQWAICESAAPTSAMPSKTPTATPTSSMPSSAPTEKIFCYQSHETCYEISGILGSGCYSDPAELGIEASFASNTAGSTANMWEAGFNYTPESLCKQACEASPLCGGFYFAAQNGVTCKFQSIAQAASAECLDRPGMKNCANIPASGSQCWWNDEWPSNCVEHYADVNNQEHMHWICSGEAPEETPAELPYCECHEGYGWTSFGEVCETHCMTTSGMKYCHPGNGDSSDPLHMEPCGRQECWPENQVRCRMPEPASPEPATPTSEVCSSLKLVTGTTSSPGNLASQANLQAICGMTCADSLGLSHWSVCGLSDGQLDGPGHGGAIEDPQQSGYDCWVQCETEVITETCAELELIGSTTAAPSNLATQANLVDICGEACALTLGLADWEVCGLQDGQLDGPLHGGEIEDSQQSGYDCWIQCKGTDNGLPQAADLDFSYVALGNGEDGFCRDASGVMKFLGDWDTSTEADCKRMCDQVFACAGYQYGRSGKPLDCNLYYAAEAVSSNTNTLASCQQKQEQLGHSGYIWRGQGYCRTVDGESEFLSRVLDVDETDCRSACDEEDSCEGFAYGTPSDPRKCNLYEAANLSSGKSGLGGCWAKL